MDNNLLVIQFHLCAFLDKIIHIFSFPFFFIVHNDNFYTLIKFKTLIILVMTSPQPYRGVIMAENPRSHIQQNYPPSNQNQRPLQEILDENEHLRQMIEKIKR